MKCCDASELMGKLEALILILWLFDGDLSERIDTFKKIITERY